MILSLKIKFKNVSLNSIDGAKMGWKFFSIRQLNA